MESAMKHVDAASGHHRWDPVMDDIRSSNLSHCAQLTKTAVRVV